MDMDDLPLKKDDAVTAVEKEDLSTLGVEELGERAERLKAEIERTLAIRDAKKAGMAAAEAVFGPSTS